MATIPRSPTVQRYSPAWAPRWGQPPNLVATVLAGLDQFFGLPGQPPANLDWPNPRWAEHPTSARTWTFNLQETPTTVAAANADPRSPTYARYYPAAAPRNYDPPNLAATVLSAAAPATEPFNQSDWPAPKVTPPFLPTHSLSLLALAIGNPFTPIVYPLPRAAEQPTSARTWIQQPLCLVGQDVQFAQPGEGKSYDYPLPRQPQFPPGNSGFVSNAFQPLRFGQDQFFTAGAPVYDYPLPKQPQYPIGNRTWIYTPNLNLDPTLTGTTKFFTVGGPVYDYPLPKQPQYPIANRTWINTFNRNLIGQDVFFGVPGQPPANLDWPNPRLPVHPTGARTWTLSILDSVFAPIIAPSFMDMAEIMSTFAQTGAGVLTETLDSTATMNATMDEAELMSTFPQTVQGNMANDPVTTTGRFP